METAVISQATTRRDSGRPPVFALFVAGNSLALSVMCNLVTLASGDYRGVMSLSLLSLAVSTACSVWAYRKGGRIARCAALLYLAVVFIFLTETGRRLAASFTWY